MSVSSRATLPLLVALLFCAGGLPSSLFAGGSGEVEQTVPLGGFGPAQTQAIPVAGFDEFDKQVVLGTITFFPVYIVTVAGEVIEALFQGGDQAL